jgi:hypothetical protein
MIFSDRICPVCNMHPIGSQSKSNRHKSTFKTCGSKECSTTLRYSKHKSGATFTRSINEYTGTDLCECGNYARYQFKSGKVCCQSVASNCLSRRVEINNSIAQKLKTTVDENGLTLTQRKANKTAETKRTEIDEFGQNGYDRFSKKLKETIEASRDKYGRTYQSRSKLTDEEFFLKPEKERYNEKVWALTEQQYKEYFSMISDARLRSTEYHLDHIYSISEGFRQKVPAEVIAHYTNLRVIPASLNCNKQDECHKTLIQLYEDFALARTSSNEISL